MSKYKIKRITSDEAETVWQNSYQSSIFTHPQVLEELVDEVHWWGVYKGEEMQCSWPITLNKNANLILAPFTYWQGPLWTKKSFNHPAHRTLSVTKSVYELFIDNLIKTYACIKASFHPSLTDVRIFDWWNYHQPNKPRFIIKPRYSAIISDLQKEKQGIDKNFRLVRRQEIKKFDKIEKLFFFDNYCSKKELLSLYAETLKIDKSKIEESIISLLKTVENGFGWIQSVRKRDNSKLCGLMVILCDKEQANLVINLAKPEFKSNGLIAASIYKAIETAQQKGLKHFDFNGANSPFRGDDKHSYGAKPVLYFDVEYNVD